MKKRIMKVFTLASILSICINLQAQEPIKRQAEKNEVNVFIIKDENGERTEIKEQFSFDEQDELNALLKKYNIDLNLDELKANVLKEGKRNHFEMNMEEEVIVEELKREVQNLKLKNSDSLNLEELKEFVIKKTKNSFKVKDGEGSLKVLVMDKEDLNTDNKHLEEAGEKQNFEIRTEIVELKNEDGNEQEIKTILLITTKDSLSKQADDKRSSKVKLETLENTSIQDFKLYPNPTNGTFNMKFKAKVSTDVQLNILDSKGTVIYEKKLPQFKGKFFEEFDLSKEGAGLYFFTIKSEGEKLSQKIIIQ